MNDVIKKPAVDSNKLAKGLNMMFSGFSIAFEALAEQIELLEKDAVTQDTVNPGIAAEAAVPDMDMPMPEQTDKFAEQAVDGPSENSIPCENKADETAKETAAVKDEPPATESHTPKASANITLDDIAGVITAKLEHCVSAEKKKAFNGKMRSLLEVYQASKVSALPPEKYEAFLNDVAQISL